MAASKGSNFPDPSFIEMRFSLYVGGRELNWLAKKLRNFCKSL
uniref:Uncharacterized protein n=1 Tax=Nelumbo nucifera TaxID=4432 RepID=A0A822ZLB3_NELNU|nr:TPA_asm: hypothetical protein HUJ06_003773 [Nelumbo nucifera]